MYVETTHERPTQVGDSDVLLTLAYSAKDATMLFDNQLKGQQLRKIMRIHVYDKQANPHKAAATILKNANEKTFIEVGSTDYAKKFIDQKSLTQSSILNLDAINNQITLDAKTGKIKLTQFSNVRQIKDVVSKMVPSITYGANGSTIVSANLSSKADALLSTVNMLRSNSAKNVIMPNGSGVSGLPLRVIPATLSMSTLGCPLAQMAQIFFVDFNTGTSIDNLYVVTGLTHTMRLKPFVYSFRGKGVHSRRQEFASTWVFCEHRSNITNARCNVTASTARNDDFLAQTIILFD
jgi:hypothetical protein